jgi:squalene-associated FAD-dependent desaturase
MATVHVIGAGLAGLSCAVRVALAGRKVAVYEAAPQAGGRCRSLFDEGLGCLIDNGSHMLLGANRATLTYLDDIGGAHRLHTVSPAGFPFLDPASGKRWTLRPGSPLLPLWLFAADRRVPDTHPRDYLEVLSLARADARDRIGDRVDRTGPLYERLWQPMARAALNTDADEASAKLLWRVIAETFLKGEAACRPMIFSEGLTPTLVEPALKLLAAKGAELRYQARVRGLRWQDDRVIALHFPEGLLRVEADDAVVLAVPPEICAELWPPIDPPQETRPILNIHFRMGETVTLPGGYPFLGLIGTESHWLFARGEVLSVTVSAADRLIDRQNIDLASQIWAEVARVFGRNTGRLPPWRVIKEKRATIAQTPAVIARRPGAETALNNLAIAGDWTDTGLPATIESAIRSGVTAARIAMRAVERATAPAG